MIIRILKTSLIFLLFTEFLYASDLIEIEHIWLTQKIHVSGEYLCQDGQSIYFKSQKDCHSATHQFHCDDDLKVSPIHFIEKIELSNGQSVSHFYSIKTEFEYLRYELTAFYPVNTYDLVESQLVPIPYCLNRPILPAQKIRKIRKAKTSEIPFIQGLVRSGVSIVNSPFGSLDSIEHLKESQKKPMTNSETLGPKLRSPLCNLELDYNNILFQASGEWSGNGVIELQSLVDWQDSSKDIFVVQKTSKDKQLEYQFYCKKESSDARG